MSNTKALLEGEALWQYLPQRPPFLFVSRVLALAEDSLTTEFDIDPSFDFFRGHFPGNPITPGVILIESAAQSCVVLLNTIRERKGEKAQLAVAAGVDEVKFRAIAPPGITVRIEVAVLVARSRFFTSSFRMTNPEGKRVAEGKINAMIMPEATPVSDGAA